MTKTNFKLSKSATISKIVMPNLVINADWRGWPCEAIDKQTHLDKEDFKRDVLISKSNSCNKGLRTLSTIAVTEEWRLTVKRYNMLSTLTGLKPCS